MPTMATPSGTARSEARGNQLWRVWHAVHGWCDRHWSALRPGLEARRGAMWGLLTLLMLFVAVRLALLPSGFGVAFDAAFVTAATAMTVVMSALIVAVILTVLRRLPLTGTALLLGACVLITAGSFSQPSISLVAAVLFICLAACVVGATVSTLASRRLAGSTTATKVSTSILLVAAVTYTVGFVWVLADDGNMEKVSSWRPRTDAMPLNIAATSPGSNGPYAVRTLFYGSGMDLRRPEYNSAVAIRTPAVDASAFFRGYGGWRRWARNRFWGFDVDALPLNAQVWYPDGPGPFPLALIAHGNHRMNDFSEPRVRIPGRVTGQSGIHSGVGRSELPQRHTRIPRADGGRASARIGTGSARLASARAPRLWHDWNRQTTSPFYRKVDLDRIALMGHSRGGEAAATAASFNRMKYYPEDATIRFDYGYGLEAIVAIAPADGQYQPAQQPRWVEDVSYLTLQGAHDADSASFAGSRQADRVRFTHSGPWFSAELYAYRANHGQFNTSWGRTDFPPPLAWFLNLAPLITGDEQRRISKTYISAFLETTLNGRREYLSLFKDWRTGRHWLPETIYINRYRDASYVPVATFQEDADVASTTAKGGAIDGQGLTLWREGRIPTRRGDRGTTACSSAGIRHRSGRRPPTPSHCLARPHAHGD